MDELSYRLGLDPLELRLRNYAEVDPRSGLPWSSNGLRECDRVGAERFGWKNRNPGIGSMREGEWLVGCGMAGFTFEWQAAPCQARISINRDGTAHVRSAAMDLGTGTYTVAVQLSAELLGLDIDDVRVEIGDSDLPPPRRPAARARRPRWSARSTMRQESSFAASSTSSPRTSGRRCVAGGRATLPPVRVASTLLTTPRSVKATSTSWPAMNWTRSRRTIMGIGMATLEESVFDSRSGRIVNATFGDYLIPTNADVPDLDVAFLGEPDRFNPVGSRVSVRSGSWACPRPSPTRCTTPPAGASAPAHHHRQAPLTSPMTQLRRPARGTHLLHKEATRHDFGRQVLSFLR